jgi:2-polyprenyl-3-methyl-5-hydroxy-6-metoxy-1,4-benzoquinol methylase
MIKNNFSFFRNRSERANFIKNKFDKYIQKSPKILDVGCFDNDLKKIAGNKVFGIDICGAPDKNMDLEKESLSSFSDNSYGLVVCTEVLEHIDNFYEVLDDIKRVSEKYILISLPNCANIWKILKIITSRTEKFYGLPKEKPEDRHKWFFSWKELDEFFESYCQKNNLKIKEKFLHFNYSSSIKGKLIKFFLKIFPIKSFAQSYWILIEKNKK